MNEDSLRQKALYYIDYEHESFELYSFPVITLSFSLDHFQVLTNAFGPGALLWRSSLRTAISLACSQHVSSSRSKSTRACIWSDAAFIIVNFSLSTAPVLKFFFSFAFLVFRTVHFHFSITFTVGDNLHSCCCGIGSKPCSSNLISYSQRPTTCHVWRFEQSAHCKLPTFLQAALDSSLFHVLPLNSWGIDDSQYGIISASAHSGPEATYGPLYCISLFSH